METYTALRHFADSWGLLAMALFFVGAVVFAFRPGSRALADEAARIEAIARGDTAAKWLPAALRAAGVLKEGESL